MWTRRELLARTAAAAALLATSRRAWGDQPLGSVFDATGPFLGTRFHPARALDTLRALSDLDPLMRVVVLRAYLASKPNPPGGLLAVMRCMFDVPAVAPDGPKAPLGQPANPLAVPVVNAGFFRPPALGVPTPGEPSDLRTSPRWPVILLSDVPLVVVQGYALGGLPESLVDHLDGLAAAPVRTDPFVWSEAGRLRFELRAPNPEVHAMLTAQLDRYAAG